MTTTARRRSVDHRPHSTHPPPGRSLKAVLDLGAVTTAPGCARAWSRQILREWRLAGLSPRPRDPGTDDEDGRGLLLVQAMSSRTGWYPADDGTPGKVVWAVASGRAA